MDFDEAREFMKRLRNVKPPIYNPMRLKEKPIPSIGNVKAATSASSQQSIPAEDESIENSFEEPLIYEEDNTDNNTEYMSHDPLELSVNDTLATTEDTEISVVVENGNSVNGNEITIVTDASPSRSTDTTANNDLIDENPTNIETNSSQQHSNDMDANADLDIENSITTVINSTEQHSATINSNAVQENQEPIENDSSQQQLSTPSGSINLVVENQINIEANALQSVPASESVVENEHLTNESEINTETSPEHSASTIGIKIEQTSICFVQSIHTGNNADIDDLLDDPEEIVWGKDEEDEVVMTIGRCGFPKPWCATSDSLFKREDDPFSGNLAFTVSVREDIFFSFIPLILIIVYLISEIWRPSLQD